MKKLLLMTLLTPTLCFGNDLRTVNDSPALVAVFAELSEIASNGASLAHFSYEEEFEIIPENCKTVSSGEVDAYLDGVLTEFAAESEIIAQHKEQALKEYAAIIGEGVYESCRYSEPDYMTYAQYYQFVGENYRIRYHWGYED
jgi:hypothetical protein